MIADPDERLAEDWAFDGEEVGGGARHPSRAEALEAKRVRMAPDGGKPGGVAEVAFEEVFGGEPSAGGMVARDARDADFGMVERKIDDGLYFIMR